MIKIGILGYGNLGRGVEQLTSRLINISFSELLISFIQYIVVILFISYF